MIKLAPKETRKKISEYNLWSCVQFPMKLGSFPDIALPSIKLQECIHAQEFIAYFAQTKGT